MAWSMSTGVDVSHHQGHFLDPTTRKRWVTDITDYNRARAAIDWVQIKLTDGATYIDPGAATHHQGFAGKPRGGYCFVHPDAPIRDQIAHYLARKAAIGGWERPDMIDAEVAGAGGTWLRELIAEYRRQSGRRLVLVYTPSNPADWWDEGCVIWRARYRKIGDPGYGDNWPKHLGWDHPGLGIYQWDDAWPLPGGPLCDINSQRVDLADSSEGATVALTGADADLILDRPRPRADAPSLNTSLAGVMTNWDSARIQAVNQRNAIQATQQAHGSTLAQILDAVTAPAAVAGSVNADELVVAMAASSSFMEKLGSVVAFHLAEEQDKRARDNDAATGPTT